MKINNDNLINGYITTGKVEEKVVIKKQYESLLSHNNSIIRSSESNQKNSIFDVSAKNVNILNNDKLDLFQLIEYQNNNKLLSKIKWEKEVLTNDIKSVFGFYEDDLKKYVMENQWADSYTCFCFKKKQGVNSIFNPDLIMEKVHMFAQNDIPKDMEKNIITTFQILLVELVYTLMLEPNITQDIFKKYYKIISKCSLQYKDVFNTMLNLCRKYSKNEDIKNFFSHKEMSSTESIKNEKNKFEKTKDSFLEQVFDTTKSKMNEEEKLIDIHINEKLLQIKNSNEEIEILGENCDYKI
jgi:hypothetical protein